MKKIILLLCVFALFSLLGYAQYNYRLFNRLTASLQKISERCNTLCVKVIRSRDIGHLAQPSIILPPRAQSIALSQSKNNQPSDQISHNEFYITMSFQPDGLLNNQETHIEHEESKPLDKYTFEAEELTRELLTVLNIKCSDDVCKTLSEETYENQDKFLAEIMTLLVDPKDKRTYKTIARAAQPCSKLWEKHSQFGKLITAHSEKPKAQAFLDEFNALEDSQLPPECARARSILSEHASQLSYWEQGKLWWKF